MTRTTRRSLLFAAALILLSAPLHAQAPTYALTVAHGTGSGRYTAGRPIVITADPTPAGTTFSHWQTTDVTLANPTQASQTLTMPAHDVTLTGTTWTPNPAAPVVAPPVTLPTKTPTPPRRRRTAKVNP